MGIVIAEFLFKYKNIAEAEHEKEMIELNRTIESSVGDDETSLQTLMIHGLSQDWMEQVGGIDHVLSEDVLLDNVHGGDEQHDLGT